MKGGEKSSELAHPKKSTLNLVEIIIPKIGVLLGSKTLGTNILELQYVLCWQTMIKT